MWRHQSVIACSSFLRQRYEEDLRRVGGELNRKEKQLSRAEAEVCTRLTELREAQETIRQKGEALAAAAEAARRAELSSEEAARLRRDAEEAQEEAKVQRAALRRAQDELAMATARVADLEKYNAQLLERLQRAVSSDPKIPVSNPNTIRLGHPKRKPRSFAENVVVEAQFCRISVKLRSP